jgi:hypothetical protein
LFKELVYLVNTLKEENVGISERKFRIYIEVAKEALILDKDYKNYACLFSKEGEL